VWLYGKIEAWLLLTLGGYRWPRLTVERSTIHSHLTPDRQERKDRPPLCCWAGPKEALCEDVHPLNSKRLPRVSDTSFDGIMAQ